MTYKDLGPNVSQFPQAISPGGGQYTAEDHSWESLVIQQDKPATDWEMNLLQDVLGRGGVFGLASKSLPSCFMTNTFVDESNVLGDYIFYTPDPGPATTANKFLLKASEVLVNGWRVRFDLTELATPELNQITLPVPPVAGTRTDLVVLEVWRALVSPMPDTANKSPSGQILRYGNAKAPDQFPPGNENLADDLLDPVFAQETAKRVQIQYRYRVIPGVDISTYPDGLEDPNVFAHTVPYLLASGVDGVVTAYTYTRDPFDNGLWVAGANDGVGVTNLGTVDGMMYAVPVCAIARRNSAGFDRSTNLNGGISMTVLTPDRPDDLYADQVVVGDLLDLRRGVAWDFSEVLDKTFQEVLDNTLTTRIDLSSPNVGTSFLAQDELTPVSKMGQPDGVRTSFSDRKITESAVAVVPIPAPSITAVVSLSAFTVPWSGSPVDLTVTSPTGVTLSSVTKVRVYDGIGIDYDALLGGVPQVVSIVLTAAGSYVDTATITFDAPVAAGLTLYVEVLLDYPDGNGTSRNVINPHDLWVPPAANIAAWVDVTPSTIVATSDPTRFSLYGDAAYPGPLWQCDPTHREVTVRIRTTVQNWTAIADGVTAVIWVPDILDPNVPPILSGGYVVGSLTLWTTFTAITLTAVPPPGTPVTVTYQARRPLPPLQAAPGESYQFLYQSRSIQSNAVPAGTQTLNLVPRAIGKSLHSILTGSGSPDSSFPFVSPSEQIPVGVVPGPASESALNSPSSVSVLGMNVSTGYVTVPTVIPYTPDASRTTLFSDAPDATVDSENRNFWPKSDSGAMSLYGPTAIGPLLSSKVRHKVALPALMEIKQDFPSTPPFQFRRGTLILVVFTRWIDFGDENTIDLHPTLSSSCAAVYRVRGNLMNNRRTS